MSKLPLVVEGPVPGVYTQVEDIGGFIVIPLAPDVPLEPELPLVPEVPELPEGPIKVSFVTL